MVGLNWAIVVYFLVNELQVYLLLAGSFFGRMSAECLSFASKSKIANKGLKSKKKNHH